MSLTVACGLSLGRGLLIALVSLPVTALAYRALRQSDGKQQAVLWGLLLIPYIVPPLLPAYAYANLGLPLVHHPLGNELLYSVLLLLRFVPVGTVVRYFAPPPPVSSEAFHLSRLAARRQISRINRWMMIVPDWVRGPGRSALPAGLLVFLLAFQEFEMASLMDVTSGTVQTPSGWTVWIFDAQAGGLPLAESLRLALRPVCVEFVILLPVLCVLMRGQRLPAVPAGGHSPLSAGKRWLVRMYLGLGLLIVVVIPGGFVFRGMFEGLPVLLRNVTLPGEILTGGILAVIAGLSADAVAVRFLRSGIGSRHPWRYAVPAMVLSLPGLLGALLLGLTVAVVVQPPVLSVLEGSGLPWRGVRLLSSLPLILASILFLLPRAFLLQLLLRALRKREAVHLAGLLRNSPAISQQRSGGALYRELTNRGRFGVIALLCYWGYWNLTLPSLLAPPGITTAPLRIYNLMHYRESAVHSAMLFATMTAPLFVLFAVYLLTRFMRCRCFRSETR